MGILCAQGADSHRDTRLALPPDFATRKAKWGAGAIDALSNQLQVELPGLRGFSATNIKNMRAFFEFWADDFSIRPLPMGELSIRHLPSDENCSSATKEIRQMPSAELGVESLNAFMSVGFSQHRDIVRAVQSKDEAWYYICASAKAPWSYEQLLQHLRADDYHHIGGRLKRRQDGISSERSESAERMLWQGCFPSQGAIGLSARRSRWCVVKHVSQFANCGRRQVCRENDEYAFV